jgi:nicotinamide-nucleotide amidase
MIRAEIITIGSELLNGKTTDTNGALIAKLLNELGIHVVRKVSVGDNDEDISEIIHDNSKSVSLKIFSGGLGPTHDDITKKIICRCFDSELVINEEVLSNIQIFFKQRQIVVTPTNRDQALVPDKARVFMNEIGTAPGLLLEKENVNYIFLPGVPFELENLMRKKVIPFLRKQLKGLQNNIICDFVFSGIGESFLYDLMKTNKTLFDQLSDFAFLPSPGLIKLRQIVLGSDYYTAEEIFYETEKQLKNIAEDYYVGRNIDNFALIVQEVFIKRGLSLSVAESCTGGNIAHLITSNSGSSKWFKGGIIAYSNDIKVKHLGVSENSVIKEGVVSEEVVIQMAQGVRKRFDSDFAIAVSGIAGPEGGSDKKPVGTVYIAVSGNQRTSAKRFFFGSSDRNVTIQRASIAALFMLYREVY